MTRDEVLAQYRPMRAGIQRVLRLAPAALRPADLRRALKQVAPWAEAEEDLPDGATDMLVDVALFEPNQSGRRAFDRFLAKEGRQLDAANRALAADMAAAWFSIFHLTGRHEIAGLWLEDMLDENRRLWLVDEGLETSAPEELIVAMRLFDAGPFHAGFGILVPPDKETLDFCLDAKARGARLPFRYSLAATLYSDYLVEKSAPSLPDLEEIETLLKALASLREATKTPEDRPRRPAKPRRPRTRKK
jgi:hypothetical protein